MKIKVVLSTWLLVVSLAGTAASASAQSILKSADGFTLLGGTGITNTGATIVSGGNIGLWPAATTGITGFFAEDGGPAVITPPGVIIPTGPVTQQGMGDLMQVATDLNLMPSNTNLSNQDLGGMTLLPGIYTFNAAATQALSTTLTLDANGQNGAYWVFQIGTSFTSGANANINIINLGTNLGADDGIYWDIGSSATFGANNLIAGNYLAGTGVTLGAGVNGDARILAQTAISLDSNDIDSMGGPGGNSWNSGLMYQMGSIVPVPEPAAVLWLAPLGAIGLAAWRRRAAANKQAA